MKLRTIFFKIENPSKTSCLPWLPYILFQPFSFNATREKDKISKRNADALLQDIVVNFVLKYS